MRIGTVGTTFEIIEKIAESNGMTASELAQDINKPVSTTHDYLSSLNELGYIYKRDKEYHASLKFLRLAEKIRGNMEVFRQSQATLQQTAREIDSDVLLGVEEQGKYVVVDWAKGAMDIDFGFYQGMQLPLYATAAGKILVAFSPEDYRETLIEDIEFDKKTPQTVTNRSEFRDEIEQIREEEIAYNYEEFSQGVCAIAVPIKTPNIRIASLAAVGPSRRIDDKEFVGRISDKLEEVANLLEISITGPVE